MNARQTEAVLLKRCTDAARQPTLAAADQREANVFLLASMIVRSGYPDESKNLKAASEKYFARHEGDRLSASAVLKNGWIISFPRLHGLLARQFSRSMT